MRKQKKGFTVVELVVVIAIVAVLAAVMIPTFTSIIRKANDSAYLQERTNQQLQDLIEKVENQNYLTWEDFEAKLAAAMADSANDTSEKIAAAVKEQLEGISGAGLSEEQVKKIVEKALEGQLTSAQVEAIVNQAIKNASLTPGTSGGLTEAQVRQIVNSAIAGIKQTGVTKEEMKAAITSALQGKGLTEAQVTAIVGTALDEALSGFSPLTEDDIKKIVDAYIESTTPAAPVGTLVMNETELNVAVNDETVDTIVIGSDITLSKSVSVERSVVVNLNGKTLSIDNNTYTSGGSYNRAVFKIGETASGITLTIDATGGGAIQNNCENDSNAFGIVCYTDSLVINGGVIGGSSPQSIGAFNGTINIHVNGGSINGVIFPDFCTLTLFNAGTYKVGSVGTEFGVLLPVTIRDGKGVELTPKETITYGGVECKVYVVE